jgi:uroporphyrinogen decarboxylase
VKGDYFVSFDADGTWGPIVSSPPLLRRVLVWVYKRPDVVEALIDYYTRVAIAYGECAIDEGADAIQLCVDYGNKNGPWLSPQMFRRFVKPALVRHVNAFKRKGAFVVLHSDGNIAPLLPDIVDAGVDAYQGIDVLAGMSLAEVKRRYGDKLCLVGNVDPRVIEFGTLEDVEREVDRCLREGGREGYVLSASANVSVCTNARNFIHMIEYAKRKGFFSR